MEIPALLKVCTKCRLPRTAFVKDRRNASGLGAACVECSRTGNRSRQAERKPQYKVAGDRWRQEHREELRAKGRRSSAAHREFLNALKADQPCLDCDDTFPPFCMEYDHVRGTKRTSLAMMSNHCRETVLEEIAKCDLVCCACHRVRTHARRETHGAHTGSKAKWSSNRLLNFRAWMDTLKSKPCMDCERIRPPVAMDFDHVRGTKMGQISSMWRYNHQKVVAEIEKCDLVCCICHRMRTQMRHAA